MPRNNNAWDNSRISSYFLTSDTSKFGLMQVITFRDQTYRK